MLPLSTAPFGQCGTPAKVFRDPHINFAYGGSADLRGRHNALYNFLSAPGLSVNVKTEDAVFKLHGGALTVNGSFLTEAHVTAQLSPQKRATASTDQAGRFLRRAEVRNWAAALVRPHARRARGAATNRHGAWACVARSA